MKWQSVRTRLILWNVAVLGAVLAGFGFAIRYSVEASQNAVIDRELARRVERFPRGRPGLERWGARRGPGEGREAEVIVRGLPPDPWRGEGRRFGERPPGPQGGWPDSPPRDFRRPRILNLEGASFPFSDEGPWDQRTFRLSLEGRSEFSTISVDDERVRVLSVPLRQEDGTLEGVVQAAHPLGEQDRLTASLVGTLLTLIPVGLLVAAMGGLFLTHRALKPVREVTQAAAQIGAEDLSRRLPVRGEDEISELADTFNAMTARLEDAFRNLREAYEEQRRFTSDASHELRTPLTAIKANTSLALLEERTVEEYREALRSADQAADVMSRIVQDLLFLARSDAGRLALERQPVALDEVARRAAGLVGKAGGAPIAVEQPSEPAVVLADEHHLLRLFTNLLENAVRHTPPDGRITVFFGVEEPSTINHQPSTIRVSVTDTGEGIPAEHLPHVGERFYRVDASRTRAHGGTGLGLAICRSIVQAHGGTLAIESELGRGTAVTVQLPMDGVTGLPV